MKRTFKTETISICQLNTTQKQNQSGVLTLLLWPCRESVDCLVLPELPDLRDPWESVDPPEPLELMVARYSDAMEEQMKKHNNVDQQSVCVSS